MVKSINLINTSYRLPMSHRTCAVYTMYDILYIMCLSSTNNANYRCHYDKMALLTLHTCIVMCMSSLFIDYVCVW